MTGKLTHWARLLVGCTLGLTDCDSVSLRLWDKIRIVILFPEDSLLHHILPAPNPVYKAFCLYIEPAPDEPCPKAPLVHALQFLFCWSPPNFILPVLSSQALYIHPFRTDAVTQRPGKVTLCVGLSLMYAIHFTVLSSQRKEVLFLT